MLHIIIHSYNLIFYRQISFYYEFTQWIAAIKPFALIYIYLHKDM